jgi:hypothetical protein
MRRSETAQGQRLKNIGVSEDRLNAADFTNEESEDIATPASINLMCMLKDTTVGMDVVFDEVLKMLRQNEEVFQDLCDDPRGLNEAPDMPRVEYDVSGKGSNEYVRDA